MNAHSHRCFLALHALIANLLLLACSHVPPRAPASEAATTVTAAPSNQDAYLSLKDSKFRAFKNGIFEVVVPWDLQSKVTYEEKLPYEKLPFHMRKDPYFSIGTAFAISPRILVSAAHVFDAHKISYFTQNAKIRSTSGELFEIDQVIRYSQHRDLIGFTLKQTPKNLVPLKASTKKQVGQIVFAVGNALGEGVVVRDGRIASFTPEEVNGEWKFIRFTAPASPGNSGGALLDNHGRVLGVVVRRSENENLNYAVPIEEFVNLPSKTASFFDDSWGEEEAGKSLHTPWKAELSLPKDLAAFQNEAFKAFVDSFKHRRAIFEQKFKQDLFPYNEQSRAWLREQSMSFRFAEIKPDSNGNWSAYAVDAKESRIGQDQKVQIGARKDDDHIEFYIDRPQNMPLQKFVETPNLLAKAFLDTINFRRDFASQSIKVKSLGKPKANYWWKDATGRPWRTTSWPIEYINGSLVSHCLATPKGLACRMSFTQLWQEPLNQFYAHTNARRLSLSYNGRLMDWREFLSLPKEYIPEVFHQETSLNKVQHQLRYRFEGIKGVVEDPQLSENSEISVGMFFDIHKPTRLSVFKVVMKPQSHKNSAYASEYVFEPAKLADKDLKNRWEELSQKGAPYDGKTRHHMGGHQTFHVLKPYTGRMPATSAESKLVFSCYHDNSVNLDASKKLCDSFQRLSTMNH